MKIPQAGRWQELACILVRSDYGPVALTISLLMVSMGAWAMNPYLDTFGASASFKVMAKIAPEFVWGAIVVFLGAGLFFYTCLSHNRFGRRVFALLCSAFWVFFGIGFILANAGAWGGIINLNIGLACAWVYWRAKGQR